MNFFMMIICYISVMKMTDDGYKMLMRSLIKLLLFVYTLVLIDNYVILKLISCNMIG